MQLKILHIRIAIRYLLFLMRIVQSDNCILCNEMGIDSIYHALNQYPKSLWQDLETRIRVSLKIDYQKIIRKNGISADLNEHSFIVNPFNNTNITINPHEKEKGRRNYSSLKRLIYS